MNPIFRLPPYTRSVAIKALSETVDWGLTDNNIPNHWKDTKGKGVKVAVLDTGVDASHPDLKDAVLKSKDFTRSPYGVSDIVGHGTHTAGTIGARANGVGVIGVAPECSLLIGKVLGDDGSGSGAWVAAGVRWAILEKANIISMSLGSAQDDPRIHQSLNDAISAGIIVICAAGNDGMDNSVNFPGRYTIAIAAYDKQFKLTSFSSRGPQVVCAAPGQDVLSTVPVNQGSYAKMSGTSMATPFVAGVAALAVSIGSNYNPTSAGNEDLAREYLRKTSKDAGDPGFDTGYGWGLINPDTLLSPPPAEPVPPPTTSTWLDLLIIMARMAGYVVHQPAVAGDILSIAHKDQA